MRSNGSVLAVRAWEIGLARGLSLVISPPVVVLLITCLIASTMASVQAWALTAQYVLLAVGVPLGFMVWFFMTGRITDLEVSVRAERTWPLLITLGGMLLGWLLLAKRDSPPLLLSMALANLLQVALFLSITQFWKISMHCTAVGAFVVVVGVLFGALLLLVTLTLIPAVAWSRVRLQRHTPGQTIAGALLGGSITLTILMLFGG